MFQPLAEAVYPKVLRQVRSPAPPLPAPAMRSDSFVAHGFTWIGLNPSGTRCSPITK